MDAWVWILLVVVVVAVVAAVLATRSRQQENRRVEAAELRDPTADHHMELREKEAAATASEAEARRVRAEADQRAAEAEQLQVQAQRAAMDRDSAESEAEAKLRRADALDPDVKTDKEGHRIDEQGNRVAAGAGAGAALGAASDDDERVGENADSGEDTVTRDASAPGRSDEAYSEHGPDHDTGAPTGGRVGNMRGLDEDDTTPWSGDDAGDASTLGRSDEAQGEDGHSGERVGNMRGVDDDDAVSTDEEAASADRTSTHTDSAEDPTSEPEPGDKAVGEMDERDQARDRVDDVLGRRDADGDGRRG